MLSKLPDTNDFERWIEHIEAIEAKIIKQVFKRPLRSTSAHDLLVRAYQLIWKRNYLEEQIKIFSEHGKFFTTTHEKYLEKIKPKIADTIFTLMNEARNHFDTNLDDEISKLVSSHTSKNLPNKSPAKINFAKNLCFFLKTVERLPISREEFREYISDYAQRHPEVIEQSSEKTESSFFEEFDVNHLIKKNKTGVKKGTKRISKSDKD